RKSTEMTVSLPSKGRWQGEGCSVVTRSQTHLINRNGCVAGDLALRQGARTENILYGSLSDANRRSSVKDPATLRAEFWRAAGGVAPQSSGSCRAAMLLRRALPAARQDSALLVPIHEMGSEPLTSILSPLTRGEVNRHTCGFRTQAKQ